MKINNEIKRDKTMNILKKIMFISLCITPICSNGYEEKEKYDSLSRDIDRLEERLLAEKLEPNKKAEEAYIAAPGPSDELIEAALRLSAATDQLTNPEQRKELHHKIYITLYGERGENQNQ
jgi:hypothetical protein